MSKVCEICGRGPKASFSVSHAHNRNKRRWEINLQHIRVVINGSPKQIKVCTRCIQAGKIEKPKFVLKERKIKVLDSSLAQKKTTFAEEIEEQTSGGFFSDQSLVDVIFKKKKKLEDQFNEDSFDDTLEEEGEEEQVSADPQIQIVETEIIPDNSVDIYSER
ncbi:50S ribosomal protein L28 [bacterium]|nr:50S ribosomal protein L28 [bacterium]